MVQRGLYSLRHYDLYREAFSAVVVPAGLFASAMEPLRHQHRLPDSANDPILYGDVHCEDMGVRATGQDLRP